MDSEPDEVDQDGPALPDYGAAVRAIPWRAVIAIGVVFVLGAISAIVFSNHTSPTHRNLISPFYSPCLAGKCVTVPSTVPVTVPAATVAPPLGPPSVLTRSDAPAVAEAIVLQSADAPSGFTQTGNSTYLPPQEPAVPDVCLPVSAAPWDGYATTTFHSPSNAQYITASVWVMPDAPTALRAVNAVLAPSFGPGCLQPSFDASYKRSAFGEPEPPSCGTLTYRGSQITPLARPVTGWHYTVELGCATSDPFTSSNDEDFLIATHGPIVVQIEFSSLGPPPAVEQRLLATMEFLASHYSVGAVPNR